MYTFPKGISAMWNTNSLVQDWTDVTESISYDSIHYTTNNTKDIYIYIYIYMKKSYQFDRFIKKDKNTQYKNWAVNFLSITKCITLYDYFIKR